MVCQEPLWWCVLRAVCCSSGSVISSIQGERSHIQGAQHIKVDTQTRQLERLFRSHAMYQLQKIMMYQVDLTISYWVLFLFIFFSLAGGGEQGICGFYFSFVIKFKVDFTGLSPLYIAWWHDCLLVPCQMQGVLFHLLQYIPETPTIQNTWRDSEKSVYVVSSCYKDWFQSARAGSPTQNNTPLARGKGKKCTFFQKDLTRSKQSARMRFESSKSNTTYSFQTVVWDSQAPKVPCCGVQIPWQEFKVFLVRDRNDFMSCTLRVLI